MGVTVKIIRNDIAKVADDIEAAVVQVVQTDAEAWRSLADDLSPVKSGAERVSWYVKTPDDSGYAQNAADAQSQGFTINEAYGKHIEINDEIEAPPDNTTAYIASAVAHATYQELGTSRTPAQPALIPAGEQIQERFQSDLEQAIAAAVGE